MEKERTDEEILKDLHELCEEERKKIEEDSTKTKEEKEKLINNMEIFEEYYIKMNKIYEKRKKETAEIKKYYEERAKEYEKNKKEEDFEIKLFGNLLVKVNGKTITILATSSMEYAMEESSVTIFEEEFDIDGFKKELERYSKVEDVTKEIINKEYVGSRKEKGGAVYKHIMKSLETQKSIEEINVSNFIENINEIEDGFYIINTRNGIVGENNIRDRVFVSHKGLIAETRAAEHFVLTDDKASSEHKGWLFKEDFNEDLTLNCLSAKDHDDDIMLVFKKNNDDTVKEIWRRK